MPAPHRPALTPPERYVYDTVRTRTDGPHVVGVVAQRRARHAAQAAAVRLDGVVAVGRAATLARLHAKGYLSVVVADTVAPIYLCTDLPDLPPVRHVC